LPVYRGTTNKGKGPPIAFLTTTTLELIMEGK